MYAIGTQLRAAGFQAIGTALAGIYLDTVNDILNIKLEIDKKNPLSRIFGPAKFELTLLSAKLEVGGKTFIDAKAADIEGDIKSYIDKSNGILKANHLAQFIQKGTGPFEKGVIESVKLAKKVQARLEKYTG